MNPAGGSLVKLFFHRDNKFLQIPVKKLPAQESFLWDLQSLSSLQPEFHNEPVFRLLRGVKRCRPRRAGGEGTHQRQGSRDGAGAEEPLPRPEDHGKVNSLYSSIRSISISV